MKTWYLVLMAAIGCNTVAFAATINMRNASSDTICVTIPFRGIGDNPNSSTYIEPGKVKTLDSGFAFIDHIIVKNGNTKSNACTGEEWARRYFKKENDNATTATKGSGSLGGKKAPKAYVYLGRNNIREE